MQIEYKKKAVKYINSCDRATKQRLKIADRKIAAWRCEKVSRLENDFRLRVGRS